MSRKYVTFCLLWLLFGVDGIWTLRQVNTDKKNGNDTETGSMTPYPSELKTQGATFLVFCKDSDPVGQIPMMMDWTRTFPFEIIYSCSDNVPFEVDVDTSSPAAVLDFDPLLMRLPCDTSNQTHMAAKNSTGNSLRGKSETRGSRVTVNTQLFSRKFNLTLTSELIGIGSIDFKLRQSEDISQQGDILKTVAVKVLVVRQIGFMDTLFVVCLYVLEIMEMLVFGSQLDLDVVKHTLKKPIPPLIGLSCQYLAMPLVRHLT